MVKGYSVNVSKFYQIIFIKIHETRTIKIGSSDVDIIYILTLTTNKYFTSIFYDTLKKFRFFVINSTFVALLATDGKYKAKRELARSVNIYLFVSLSHIAGGCF